MWVFIGALIMAFLCYSLAEYSRRIGPPVVWGAIGLFSGVIGLIIEIVVMLAVRGSFDGVSYTNKDYLKDYEDDNKFLE